MNITLRQNLTNHAWSQYSNMFFDRGMVLIGGRMIGLNCKNLSSIEGSTDNDEQIDSFVSTGLFLPYFADKRESDLIRADRRAKSFFVKGRFEDNEALEFEYKLDSFPRVLTGERKDRPVVGTREGSLKFYGFRKRLGEFISVRLNNSFGKDFYVFEVSATIDVRRKR